MRGSSDLKIIIQARTGSTRLPGKMLLPFYEEKSILEIVIEGLVQTFGSDLVILASTVNIKDDPIESIAQSFGLSCYRGSEENVLDRFISAARKFEAKKVIRICADNPFLQFNLIKELADKFLASNYDYLSWFVNNDRPSIKTHSGLFAEAVSLAALEKVARLTSSKFYQEHVTNYIYENPSNFDIAWLEINDSLLSKIRLTIDNNSDFKIAQNIYRSLAPDLCYTNIQNYLANNDLVLERMAENIKKNEK